MSDLAPFALKIHTLAYYDTTFSGLVPCKVIDFRQPSNSHVWEAQIKLTATRAAYRIGEILWAKATHVPPRTCVYQQGGHIRVRNAWHVEHHGQRHDVFFPADA